MSQQVRKTEDLFIDDEVDQQQPQQVVAPIEIKASVHELQTLIQNMAQYNTSVLDVGIDNNDD